MGFVDSSETATARIAATRESTAYSEGIVAMTAAGEMERVPVAKSRDARGSSESGAGRVDVLGLAASMAVDEMGPVTIIVGG